MYKGLFDRVGKKLTISDIKSVETSIGCKLPEDLVRHYMIYNGGQPNKNIFLDDDESEYEVNTFLRMKYKAGPLDVIFEDTVEVIKNNKQLLPESFFPFARDSGGNFYCINDIDNNIYYCEMDCFENNSCRLTNIAINIEEFIHALQDENEIY